MSVLASPQAAPYPPSRAIALIGLTLAAGYAVFFVASYFQGFWLVDGHGRAIASDFSNLWSAGKLALEGKAASAYDWEIEKAVQVAGVGHDFENYYPWFYPPVFFFAVAPFALLPFVPASFTWLAVTGPLYAAAIVKIIGNRAGLFFAFGFPTALWNIAASQNGFLTAALIGGTLFFIPRRPLLAGCLLGLLAYKPQYGLLFPLALMIGGYWRVFFAAAATVLLLSGASFIAFGHESWQAFLQSMPLASQTFFVEGRGTGRLQSIFGLVRLLGGSENMAWLAHMLLAVPVTLGICWLWRSKTAAYDLKAAALSIGILIVTPYIYIYDLAALAVPAAFLLRMGLATRFSTLEIAGLLTACVLVLVYPAVLLPCGLAATLIVGSLILARGTHAEA